MVRPQLACLAMHWSLTASEAQPGVPRSPWRNAEGVMPNRLRNARLKCAELENPQANAISEIVRSARRERSPRQPSRRVVQMWSVIDRSHAANAMWRYRLKGINPSAVASLSAKTATNELLSAA